MVLVVGGPQYRVGSHRQFVLLARCLADAGIPVLRFDYRGMGDSGGTLRSFEAIHDDIAAACDLLCEHVGHVRGIVLWGLCDAASANAFYAADGVDERILGQVALNPWVRTPEGEAEAYVKHYYWNRLASGEFWRKLLSGRTNPVASAKDFVRKLVKSRRHVGSDSGEAHETLPEKLCDAQLAFSGRTLLILSGQDLTAREYDARVSENAAWSAWLGSERVTLHRLGDADHTFSSERWRNQVNRWTRDWIDSLSAVE